MKKKTITDFLVSGTLIAYTLSSFFLMGSIDSWILQILCVPYYMLLLMCSYLSIKNSLKKSQVETEPQESTVENEEAAHVNESLWFNVFFISSPLIVSLWVKAAEILGTLLRGHGITSMFYIASFLISILLFIILAPNLKNKR